MSNWEVISCITSATHHLISEHFKFGLTIIFIPLYQSVTLPKIGTVSINNPSTERRETMSHISLTFNEMIRPVMSNCTTEWVAGLDYPSKPCHRTSYCDVTHLSLIHAQRSHTWIFLTIPYGSPNRSQSQASVNNSRRSEYNSSQLGDIRNDSWKQRQIFYMSKIFLRLPTDWFFRKSLGNNT